MTDEQNFEFKPDVASRAIISLSQAILAPLDAIFKAQIHAARSFLSLLLQIGYPHQPVKKPSAIEGDSEPPTKPKPPKKTQEPYTLDFVQEITVDGEVRKKKISVPALSLVPLAPLAIESGEIAFDLNIQGIQRHRQMQKDIEDEIAKEEAQYTRNKRPWFLVDDPISVRGTLAPIEPADKSVAPAEQAKINIRLKVGKTSMPAGLDKLLTSLTQSGAVKDVDQEPTQ